jgi:ribonuclease P protein component
MIPRTLRLPRQRIDYLFRKGKKLGNDSFTIRFIPSFKLEKPVNRFCVVISSALEPLAVKRNLLRRRIYEIIRLNQKTAPAGLDVIIIGKKPLTKLGFDRISANLTTLLKKLG